MKYLLSLLFSFTATANVNSIYTSIAKKDCVAISSSQLEKEPEIDHYHGECPAIGGYRVFVSGGDLRYDIKLNYHDSVIILPQISSFHEPASTKIEWRYERHKDKIRYSALIYRISSHVVNQDGKSSNKNTLYIIRLNQEKSCFIGKVSSQSRMNEKARLIAADNNAKCL